MAVVGNAFGVVVVHGGSGTGGGDVLPDCSCELMLMLRSFYSVSAAEYVVPQ